MPRIKRYWPCSHGFNRDPEIQELRRAYADWMGYVWQEMCAIGDLNDGEVKGTPEQIGVSLAYVSLTKRPSLSAKCITNALGFMEKCGWIVVQSDRVLILNHAKYHKGQSIEKVPPTDRPTIRPTIKNEEPAKPDPPKIEKPDFAPLVKMAADIAGRDSVTAHKLCQWTLSMVKTLKSEPPERTAAVVKLCLENVKQKLASGYEITSLWGLLTTIFDKERTKYMQGPENEGHKTGPIAPSVKNLMRGIGS